MGQRRDKRKEQKAEARDRGTEVEREGSKGGLAPGGPGAEAMEVRAGSTWFPSSELWLPYLQNGLKVSPFLFLRWS